jgi:hypothetical protein
VAPLRRSRGAPLPHSGSSEFTTTGAVSGALIELKETVLVVVQVIIAIAIFIFVISVVVVVTTVVGAAAVKAFQCARGSALPLLTTGGKRACKWYCYVRRINRGMVGSASALVTVHLCFSALCARKSHDQHATPFLHQSINNNNKNLTINIQLRFYSLQQCERWNPRLNAFVTLCPDSARTAAAAADARRASGQAPLSPLDGVPVAVKE